MSLAAKIALVLTLLLGGAVAVSGCGEDRSHLLPPQDAQEMSNRIDEIQRLVDEGDCFGALEATDGLQKQIELLPGSVDRELKRSLLDGVVTLTEVQKQCEVKEPSGTTDSTSTVEPETETTTGETGETGTTGTTDTGATGTTGTTDKEPSGNGKPTKPETDPDTDAKPPKTTPVTPPSTDPPADTGPGSGGITPNQ